jgi:alginate O-acetyltransferase complex protein AlgI
VILVVVIGWVFFRAETLAHALQYLQAMADCTRPPLFNSQIFIAVNSEFYITLALAVIGSAPVFAGIRRWWTARQSAVSQPACSARYWTVAAAQIGSLGFVLVYSIACIMGGAHNPFLCFRF